jgi:methylenetetrahydrofolate dehydrogenase (NADP+)/methenyltetrahydrofolate cyclohydrolase
VTARVIDGTAIAVELRQQLRSDLADLRENGIAPGIGTVTVGDEYASHAYERRIHALAEELELRHAAERLPDDAEEADVQATVGKLNADPRISGILILRPLPKRISEAHLYPLLDPLKDIEAVHPQNAGLLALGRPRYVPSTPASCFFLLDRYVEETGRDSAHFYDGRNLVLVGRSNNVGKPAVWLGLARNCTVISAHRDTFEAGRLAEHTRTADILIVAAGVPNLIGPDDVKEGVIAIDVGINPLTDPATGKVRMVGDLDYEGVRAKAEAITPVPGGVGPVTDLWVLSNTLAAAANRSGRAGAGGPSMR